MQNQNTKIIVSWFNNATMRLECEIFEMAAMELACKYANMIKEYKICDEVKIHSATTLIEL